MPIFEKRAIESVDRIIAVSNFTKNQIMKKYHIDKEKIDVIYNGIDMNLSHFNEEDLNAVRNEYNLANKLIILFVGRVDDPRKGLPWLLQAFGEVRKKHDALLVVVGSGDQTNPKRIADSLNILDDIIFTGFIDDILLKKIFKISNLYVCPSQLEGFGLTLLEAFVAGIPVIASNVGALPEIIKYYKNGYLVNYGNIEELVKKINEIINNIDFYNEVNHIDLGKIFNWSNNAKILLENYEDFITIK
jgi:glycosyltransferase involved in cell wall biosynthesis